MELEGLDRSLKHITENGVTMDCIVTDRHNQVAKYLREKQLTHHYDVWHFEKVLTKKLRAASKRKGCEKLATWLPMIRNQVYWIAASSTTGAERLAKLNSMLNHIQDKHTHDDPLYPRCEHDLHPGSQQKKKDPKKDKWLQPGTLAFYKLVKQISSKRVQKDVEKLSPHHQMSSLEAFHSLVIRFAPKSVAFSYIGMLCRLYLAAMH
ncbi:hypothetical protein ABVT39_007092 [Epinephelus coioides]